MDLKMITSLCFSENVWTSLKKLTYDKLVGYRHVDHFVMNECPKMHYQCFLMDANVLISIFVFIKYT